MSNTGDWSPDQPLGTETFEQGDEARDEGSRFDPDFTERVEDDPTLDPTLVADRRELEELGAQLDDPEEMVTLDGGMDDPDGLDRSPGSHDRESDGGWDLDADEKGGVDSGQG